MNRNELDFLHVEAPTLVDRARWRSPSDNSATRVLWEVGLVLAGALAFAVAINEALTLFRVI
jgi:hypothetical protein